MKLWGKAEIIGVLLTVGVDSPMDDVIRLRLAVLFRSMRPSNKVSLVFRADNSESIIIW